MGRRKTTKHAITKREVRGLYNTTSEFTCELKNMELNDKANIEFDIS